MLLFTSEQFPAVFRSYIEAIWPALMAGCFLMFILYLLTAWVLAHFGVQL